MSAPKSSVFTYESKVHSCHVLQRLDEQRLRDALCDVTVLVEGQSFRAHRSVLAACSEYFAHRITSLTQQGARSTLPSEVTAAGFEPLLTFAYTSKLLFSGDNVADIRNSANALGFRDLEEACFDFLIPKFSGCNGPSPFLRKPCCKKKCKRQLSMEEPRTGSSPMVTEKSNQLLTHQLSRKRLGAARSLQTLKGKVGMAQINISSSAQSTDGSWLVKPDLLNKEEDDNQGEFTSNASTSKGNHCATGGRDIDEIKQETNETEEKSSEMSRDLHVVNKCTATSAFPGSSLMLGEGSSRSILNCCPLKTCGDVHTGSLGEERIAREPQEDKKIRGACEPEPTAVHRKMGEEIGKERQTVGTEGAALSSVERQVAEHLAQRLGSDLCSSQLSSPNPLARNLSNTGSTNTGPEWMDLRLTPKPARCSFFVDSDQNKCSWRGAELSECEGASHSGVSSFNSGEDGDSGTETEGDSESYTRERAKEVQLPFPVHWVVDLSRNEFQQLLKQQVFTREQLEFVHDVRRRSKNRLAARCRKRKLDCIYNLQCEINKLKAEKEKLIAEKSQLGQLKMKTCDSVSALCQKVCEEASLQPQQLQVLAKYTSPECPLSSIF
uniref:BTB domain-containing protein n=1 Tax=Tetraodon nigroviridis TaxID=99883 RepID=H3C6C2_TETNG